MPQNFIAKYVRFFIINATVLLQNATVITKYDNFITKCDSYYKVRHLLQIATVQYIIYFRNNARKWSTTLLNEAEYCSCVIFLDNYSNGISHNRM